MSDDQAPKHAAFVFSPDADQRLIETLRTAGLPDGVRYVASVTGPWQVFAVLTYDRLAQLPEIVRSVFGMQGGKAVDPPTATILGADHVRKSEYRAETALVRIHAGGDDPQELIGEVREAIGSDEADLVLGDFDILACVVADSEEELEEVILNKLRRIAGIRRTVTLRVIDYVSLSENAPREKRPPATQA